MENRNKEKKREQTCEAKELEEWLFSINKSRKAYKNTPPTSYKRK